MNEHTIVALMATPALADFLQNALLGITRVGIDPQIILVARPDSAASVIDPIVQAAGAYSISFTEFCAPSPDFTSDTYVEYGTPAFVAINWAKVRYLKWLSAQYRHVVYADVDIGWLGDPLWYLQAVARQYPLAFQTEAVRRFPPVFCWGLVSVNAGETSQRLFDLMLAEYDNRPPGSAPIDEQITCDELIAQDLGWISHIYPLPEALFLNGLSYKSLLSEPAPAATLQGALAPFTFHANWTKSVENKRALMKQTGTWLLP